MPKKLTPAQLERYQRDGFVFGIRGFSPEQAQEYRRKLEAYEESFGAKITALGRRTKHKMKTYLLRDWAYEIATTPAILDAVEDVIGPNILLAHGNIFIKEPRTPEVAAWHQDSAYFGLTPTEEVAVWIALTDATAESGYMKFMPGSINGGQLQHKRGYVGSMNSLAQAVDMQVNDADAVQGALSPGEFSMHHAYTLHYSGPNQSSDRRIGYQLVFVPTHVRCTGTQRRTAVLVRGVDEHHNFDLDPAPLGNEAEIEKVHELACQRFRECHDEQVRWHESGLDKYGQPKVSAQIPRRADE